MSSVCDAALAQLSTLLLLLLLLLLLPAVLGCPP